MASRNGSERGAVVAQSARPVLVRSVSVSNSASIVDLAPVSQELVNGNPMVAEAGQLFILQCTQNMNVRLVGSGTAQATATYTVGAAAHGAGASNAAFTFIAGSSGACTITIGSVTGITITGSGTAATDATAMVAAIQASAANSLVTATANAGDVRLVAKVNGTEGNALATVVTATGGAKLSAAGATLTGGTDPSGNVSAVVEGTTVTVATGAAPKVLTTAAALVAAINADARVGQLCVAKFDNLGTITLTAKNYGAGANVYTTTASGTGLTAGASTFASGAGPSAGTTAANAYYVAANQPFFVYRWFSDVQLDVLAAASGTLQIFYGV